MNHPAYSHRFIETKKHCIIMIILNFVILVIKLHFLRRIDKEIKMIEGIVLKFNIVLTILTLIRNEH